MNDKKFLKNARLVTVDWDNDRIVADVPAEQSDDAQKIIADIEKWRQELNRKGGDDVGRD